MKRKHLLLLCIYLWTFSIFSQPIDYKIQLSAVAIPATCQGNGEIHCSISHELELDIEQVRYFYIPLSGIDSIVETSLPDITHLRPGDYKIKVSALCYTGLSGENAYIILSDSIENLHIGSLYSIPHSWMIYNIYSFSAPYGIVPSLSCTPTGKIQVKIQNGTFPYHLEIWKTTSTGTVKYREITFDTNQYQGFDPSRYDFKDYYTLDSLEEGSYQIRCSDGCGYHMPVLQASVPRVKYFNSRDFHLLRNSSGIPESHNIITFKELSDNISHVGHNDDYYRQFDQEDGIFFYRFVNPTLQEGVLDTTAWYKMPVFEQHAFLYDTLNKLRNYGDIWSREILLQIQPSCGDTLFSYPFTIYCHGHNYALLNTRSFNYQTTPANMDYCEHSTYSAEYEIANQNISVSHYYPSCQDIPDTIDCLQHFGYTKSGGITNIFISNQYHSYITFPLKHNIINITQDTLVSSASLDGDNYSWSHIFLDGQDFHNDLLLVEITDAHDNPLFADTVRYNADTCHFIIPSSHKKHIWEAWPDHNLENHLCPEDSHYVAIYQPSGYVYQTIINNERHYTYERDTIQLVESPGGNFYNFTAIPNTEGYWNVYRDNPDNHAVIGKSMMKMDGSRYLGFMMSDQNLLPGRYVWVVHKPCPTNDTIIMNFEYDLPDIKEPPQYVLDTACTVLNIIPVKGQYAQYGRDLETFFQVYTDDTLFHTTSAVRKDDTLSVGVPGTYKIGMYTLPRSNESLMSKNPCLVLDTTITWNNETVMLEYIYGHVCNEYDLDGFVHVKGKMGMQPYTYTLYSGADGSGNIIASNHNGIFDHIPVHFGQIVSVEITDACDAHFITNLTISDMDKIRKCWTGDNQNFISMIVGDTCYLYGLSLGGVSYHWSGPNGFSCETQNAMVALESVSNSGIYRISIEGGGCGVMRDSIVILALDNMRPCPSAIDYDGNEYNAVRINGLCWTQTNLRSEHYSDGRPIDSVRIYEHPNFTPEQIVEIFGMLYRWADAADTAHLVYADAAHHIQGVCPEGWYLPTREQYEALGFWGAPALRSPDYWINGAGGTNETGFSALPAGFYDGTRKRFVNLLGETRFWSANPHDFSENPQYHSLNFFCGEMQSAQVNAPDAYSIRCILAE